MKKRLVTKSFTELWKIGFNRYVRSLGIHAQMAIYGMILLLIFCEIFSLSMSFKDYILASVLFSIAFGPAVFGLDKNDGLKYWIEDDKEL